ncbi:MAG: TetR/AcrR family transcriptional regulator [Alphaproteobacteria bacterium]|nr:TetR/AcrR family transcriptional regulator [Alphaproteobacteria bacterium]
MSDKRETSPARYNGAAQMWNRANKSRTNQKREAIIQVALWIFQNKGYRDTTFSDIAEQLGITNKAIYYYFKSKEELFAHAVMASQAAIRDIMEQVQGFELTRLDRIRLHLRRVMEQIRLGGPLVTEIPDELAGSDAAKEIVAEEIRQQACLIDWVHEGHEDGSIRRGDASAQWNIVLGSMLYLPRWMRTESGYDWESAKQVVDDLIVHYLAADVSTVNPLETEGRTS